MPVLFDDLTEGDRSRTVAWLRFVEEEDSRGVQAALFETSADGEPQAFYFTRIDLNDPRLNPNTPKDTDGRREDSGRVGEGATGEMAGLHWGRLEVGGRSSVAA